MAHPSGLSVSVYYRLTWQVLLLLVAMLVVGSEAVRPLVVLPFLFVAIGMMSETGARYAGRAGMIRRQLFLVLAVALLLLIGNEIVRTERFEDLVPALLELLCGFLPLILLTHDRSRSYWFAVLTTVVLAVGSISVASSVVVYLAFFAYIGMLLLSLNAANLRRPEVASGAEVELPRGYFRQFFQALPAGALAAVVIFLAFPRVQSFTMSLSGLVSKPRTGYSGTIALAGGGELQLSQTVAFHVETVDRAWLRSGVDALLFRGNSLDTFDGVNWSGTISKFQPHELAGDVRAATSFGQKVYDLRIHMEPTSTTAVFYPGILLSIGGLLPASAGHLLFNGNSGVVRDRFNLERFDYSVRVAPPLPAAALPLLPLARFGESSGSGAPEAGAKVPLVLDPKERALYLAVPAVVAGAPYFQAWVREIGVDPAVATLAAADVRLAAYFAANFRATLANTFTGSSALAAFLTDGRHGHCEYFATATALLLRTLGVPTRVVVGYRGGTYNQLIDMLEVREENAHAWVEAFVPGVGWQALDPTPAQLGSADDGLVAWLRLYVNAGTFLFHQYVIDYDQTQQRQLLHSLQSLGGSKHGDQSAWVDLFKKHGKGVAVGCGALTAAGFAARYLRRRRTPRLLPAYYLAFLDAVAKAGHGRAVGETYATFHARLALMGVLPEALPDVAAAIERDLYAATVLTEAQRAALLVRVKGLTTAGMPRGA